jgi:hypothetical protein
MVCALPGLLGGTLSVYVVAYLGIGNFVSFLVQEECKINGT